MHRSGKRAIPVAAFILLESFEVNKLLILLMVCAGTLVSAHAQTPFQCPKNTEDMMNYFLMAYPDRTDHSMGSLLANPIYSSITPEINSGYVQQGYFVWTKSELGYPWDVRTFDKNYIYDRATELVWVDPTSFKRFKQDMKLSPRCVSTKGSGDTMKTTQKQSAYRFYTDCEATKTADLGYVTNAISAPVMADTGDSMGTVKTRILTYSYGCNSSYSQCAYKETFSLGLNIGLYDWKYYISKKGKWVLQQESDIDLFTLGQSVPMFSCTNTYQ
jgi:hypothetical protein